MRREGQGQGQKRVGGFHRATKNAPGGWVLYNLLLLRGFKRAFGGLYVHMARETARLRGEGPYPVIFCLTHSGWYDGHIAAILDRRIFRHDSYLMMEQVNLARYFFFTWMGVFGVDRGNARNALASIDYITGVLRENHGKGKALWMFPQGTMRHPDARPLELYGGVANVARRIGVCAIVPVALRYDFLMEQAPDAFVRFGEPILHDPEEMPVSSRELTAELQEAMTREADRLHMDVAAYDTRGYRRVLAGRGSINKGWDKVVHAGRRVVSTIAGR